MGGNAGHGAGEDEDEDDSSQGGWAVVLSLGRSLFGELLAARNAELIQSRFVGPVLPAEG